MKSLLTFAEKPPTFFSTAGGWRRLARPGLPPTDKKSVRFWSICGAHFASCHTSRSLNRSVCLPRKSSAFAFLRKWKKRGSPQFHKTGQSCQIMRTGSHRSSRPSMSFFSQHCTRLFQTPSPLRLLIPQTFVTSSPAGRLQEIKNEVMPLGICNSARLASHGAGAVDRHCVL